MSWLSGPIGLKRTVTVRRETFGALCYDRETRRFAQVDDDGFEVLRPLAEPMTFDRLLARLAARGFAADPRIVEPFLARMRERGIVGSQSAEPSGGAVVIEADPGELQPGCLLAPSTCTIYLTEVCPKQCLHCITRSDPRRSTEGYITFAQWVELLGRLRRWGVFNLVVTGGEPFVHPQLFELLQTASDTGFGVSLLTDFDGLNADHVRRLASIEGLVYLQTSLDGATAPTHDFLRGAGSFARTLRRLAVLRDAGIPYTISTVVHKRNFHELRGIVDLYHQYGAACLYLNPLAPYGRARDMLVDITLDDEQLRQLAMIYYYVSTREGVRPGNAFWEGLTDTDVLASDFHPFQGVQDLVSVGSYVFSIGSRGECYLDSKMKAEGLLYLGNALSDDLRAMWRDPRVVELRRLVPQDAPRMTPHAEVVALVESRHATMA